MPKTPELARPELPMSVARRLDVFIKATVENGSNETPDPWDNLYVYLGRDFHGRYMFEGVHTPEMLVLDVIRPGLTIVEQFNETGHERWIDISHVGFTVETSKVYRGYTDKGMVIDVRV